MIYIQRENGILSNDLTFTAWLGCEQCSFKYLFFEDIDQVPLNNMVIGYIEDSISYFKRSSINIPKPLNIPLELESHTCREIQQMSFKTFKSFPIPIKGIFIKPADKLKLFPSGVIKKESSKLPGVIGHIDDNEICLVSEVIDILSEYRVFVNKGQIIGIKHYQGNFKLFPSITIIEYMISLYTSAPISYTLDVGIISGQHTILIECNDGWSIGPYGLEPEKYIKLLIARWRELAPSTKFS